jgi:type IV pilus assembly protein PilN
MIRINLLERRKEARAQRQFNAAQLGPVLCTLLIVGTGILLGWRFWTLRQDTARLVQDVARAEQDAARLRSALQEVERFEKRKAQIQERVALIEELRRGQNGPVHLLDEVSRSVPDRLWLTELRQQNADVQIQGRASSLTALSDFVGNLEASGYFARPVEIVDSQVETVQGSGDLVRFSVKATFVLPGMPAPTPPAPAPRARPAGAAAARPAR